MGEAKAPQRTFYSKVHGTQQTGSEPGHNGAGDSSNLGFM